MAKIKKEIVIIGGGPAGLTAAIYAKRANKDLVLLEANLIGGQLTSSSIIENYPGFKSAIPGAQLAQNMKEQADSAGVNIVSAKAVKIDFINSNYIARTEKDTYNTQTVIMASGAHPKKLNITGENEFIAKGVSYCATCDAPLFKNKIVAVIGGGDVALEEALYLSEFALRVYLIHRRQGIRAAVVLEDRVKANKKIELILNSTLEAIEGDSVVRRIRVKNKINKGVKDIKVDGVFVFVGSSPNSMIVEGLVEMDENKFIITDESMACGKKGFFAAGDVRKKKYRQIVLACADGAIAGLSAGRYINENSY